LCSAVLPIKHAIYTSFKIFCIAMWFNCQSGLVLLTIIMIILLSKFRVTKISVSYITGENHIGSSFIRQKYFCLPTKIAVLPTEASNKMSGGEGGVTPPPPHPPKNISPYKLNCTVVCRSSSKFHKYIKRHVFNRIHNLSISIFKLIGYTNTCMGL
jgi:hypothetical protein